MSFADNMRVLREQKNMTKTELAEYVGVTHAAISYYESGQKMPNAVTAAKIARMLDTTVEKLVNGDTG